MGQQTSSNGFLTKKDIIYWMTIVACLIGPYLVHERRISDMATDVAVIKSQMIDMKELLNKHVEGERGVASN